MDSKINSMNITGSDHGRIDIIGFLMVIIPLISSILLWYWFYYLDSVGDMSNYLIIVSVSTVLLTTILATLDSHRLGVKVIIYKKKEIYGGSFLKFFIFLLLWIYAYPVYLFRRKNYGGRNLLYPMIFTLLIFIFSGLYIYYAVQMKLEYEKNYPIRVLRYRNIR